MAVALAVAAIPVPSSSLGQFFERAESAAICISIHTKKEVVN